VREGQRDEMILSIVGDGDPADFDGTARAVQKRLGDVLGVAIRVDVVSPGSLDEWTEIATAPKPKRFRDER